MARTAADIIVYLIQSAVWNKSRGGKFHLPVKVGKEPLICRRENVEHSHQSFCFLENTTHSKTNWFSLEEQHKVFSKTMQQLL